MASFPGAIAHCLRGLARFEGRDSRSQFWFYLLALFLAQQVVTAIFATWLMSSAMPVIAVGEPPAVAPADFFEIFDRMLAGVVGTIVLAIALLAATVTRRLHDRGLRGGWGLLPAPFLIAAMIGMYRLFGSIGSGSEPDMRLFGFMFVNNAVYLLALVVLVALLVRDSDPGDNRFGPPPVNR